MVEEQETVGGKLIVAIATIVIIAIWLGILALLVRLDVGGFGSTVLYPILKKLQNENQIDSYEKIIRNRRRKYYALTEAGRNELAAMRQDWQLYVDGIDKIVQPKGETHA